MIKRIFGVMALSAALALSSANTGRASENTHNDNNNAMAAGNCDATADLEIAAAYNSGFLVKEKIRGVIFNRSLNKDYDDVQVRVDFFDKNGSLIRSESVTLKEDVGSGEAEDFAFALNAPSGTERVSWNVVCAERDGLF